LAACLEDQNRDDELKALRALHGWEEDDASPGSSQG